MAERHAFLQRLEQVARDRPLHVAVIAEGTSITYEQLWRDAMSVAGELQVQGVRDGGRIVMSGSRGVRDFVQLLGIWLAGAAYVPLNPKFPDRRNREIASAAQEGDAMPQLAYLLFTSGTTGAPKGVPITFDNLLAYLSNMQAHYPLAPQDRIGQLADLSFDASVHEIAWCWMVGGTLCVVPSSHALMWPRYARELRMTAMLVVPSSVVLAARAGLLGADALPDARLVFLGAEALTRDVAQTMHSAAPNASLVNLWGPTEATVAFTHFAIDTAQPLPELIPIGRAFANQKLQLWDVDDEGRGELVQSGSQVASGYWNAPELTAERFVEHEGERWFRTGDLARWDERDGFCFAGRIDRQVKLRGWRIELLECETAIRAASGCDQVAVIVDADELVAFLAGKPVDIDALKTRLRATLAHYMVPSRFDLLDALPLGASGKTDYAALTQLCRACRPRS
ncbi:MAG TPA: amino acid adenylation domain-containing protein [Ramlibacter sp.]|nr:amino acid adenylation domain-containing protein [Ramlibacter sp.]